MHFRFGLAQHLQKLSDLYLRSDMIAGQGFSERYAQSEGRAEATPIHAPIIS